MKWLQIFSFLFISNWIYGQDNLSLISNKLNLFITEIDNELWIASSEQGVNLYQGNHTGHFILNDSLSGLAGSILQSKFFQDSTSNIWTTTYEYICQYINGKFSCDQLLENSEDNNGYKIIAIENGVIYLRIKDHLYSYLINSERLTQIGKTAGNSFNYTGSEIIAAPWFNSSGFELWDRTNNEWKKNEIKFKDCDIGLNDILVKSTIYTSENNLYLVTNRGLAYYDDKRACNSTLFYYNNEAIDLVEGIQIEDFIVLTTESQGVLIFSIKENKFKYQLLSNTGRLRLKANDPYELFYSKAENSLWISYTINGIQRIKWEDIKKDMLGLFDEKIFINRIRAVDDYVLYSNVENESTLLNHYGEVLFKNKSVFSSDDRIIKVLPVHNEIIYLGNQEIVKLDIPNFNLKPRYQNYTEAYNDISYFEDSLFILSGFNIYAGQSDAQEFNPIFKEQYSGEVQRFGPFTSRFKSFVVGSSTVWLKGESIDTLIDVKTYINRLTFDSVHSNFYCATNAGLHQIDSSYTVTQLAPQPWQIGNRTISEIEYHNGYVYMTIENQLARYNTATQELRYFTKDRFEHSPVFAIQDSLIHTAEKYVMSYDITEAFTDTNQYILKLDELKINREALNLYETDVSKGLELDYTQNEIAFTYYTNNWHNADLSSVRYKLLPHYPEWTLVDNGADIEFPFLPPDKYTYIIQGILPSGEMTEITEFPFQINPPWWKTNWFYSLSALSLIALLYSLYRFRLQQLTKTLRIENEMNQLEKSALQAQMNPHFIFNCLNSIQGFIMDNEKEQAMEYLGKFAKLIRLNLNASVDSTIRLDQEILILENYLALEQLRHDHSFSYQITTANNIAIDRVDIPPMLLQPFVENAVLHGMKGIDADGEIQINFTTDQAMLIIDIKDNGRGHVKTKTSKFHRSLGMSITQKRLAHINRTLNDQYAVEQIPTSQGTHNRVKIFIPQHR